MLTNKRQIKKYIDRVACDIAELLLPGAVYTKLITDETAQDILEQLSVLRNQALSRLSISYDKAPKAFANPGEYNTARRRYYREAYGKAIADYQKGVEKLLAPINEAKKA